MAIELPHKIESQIAIAKGLLTARLKCPPAVQWEIRTIAQAFVDEATELANINRASVDDVPAAPVHYALSAGHIAMAKRLSTMRLQIENQQRQVRQLARGYLKLAEEFQRLDCHARVTGNDC